jgi:hypothetical protein
LQPQAQLIRKRVVSTHHHDSSHVPNPSDPVEGRVEAHWRKGSSIGIPIKSDAEAVKYAKKQIVSETFVEPQFEDLADYANDCVSARTGAKWKAFFTSPIGWLVIAFVGLFALSVFSAGGVGMGSLTPNMFGGFTLRFWK